VNEVYEVSIKKQIYKRAHAKMEILKDLKEFILQDGLKTWIVNFRNPDNEPFYYNLYCEVKYDPKTDSRTYYYEEEHPEYYTYALSGASKEISIETALKSYLYGKLKEFERRKDDLLFLVIDDLPLLKEFASCSSDFPMLRREAKKVSPLPALTDLLIIHIGKMELVYNALIEKASGNNSTANSTFHSDEVISFGYKGSKNLLSLIYYELILEKGHFIDKEKTKFEVFVNILTSFNLKEEAGLIHFGCESTQATYIITKLEKYFSNLKFSVIGESGKFISKNGSPITAGSLSKNKSATSKVKEQDSIDILLSSFLEKG
jgi:hypothetical protein